MQLHVALIRLKYFLSVVCFLGNSPVGLNFRFCKFTFQLHLILWSVALDQVTPRFVWKLRCRISPSIVWTSATCRSLISLTDTQSHRLQNLQSNTVLLFHLGVQWLMWRSLMLALRTKLKLRLPWMEFGLEAVWRSALHVSRHFTILNTATCPVYNSCDCNSYYYNCNKDGYCI